MDSSANVKAKDDEAGGCFVAFAVIMFFLFVCVVLGVGLGLMIFLARSLGGF